MDNIQQIIHSFDEHDKEEFAYFIQRAKFKKDRKDLALFNLLKDNRKWEAEELVMKLGTKNNNAYHTIRKRLFRHLSDYILLKSQSKDENETAHILAMYNTGRYLFDKQLYESGWKYLLQAEELAIQQDAFNLLNDIYLLQMDQAHMQKQVPLEVIIEKYEQNRLFRTEDERFIIVKSVIIKELENYKASGQDINFQSLINQAFEKYGINKKTLDNPRLFLKLLQIIRSGAIASKGFHNFEPFLLSSYREMFREKEPRHLGPYHIEMLYMVSHTLYRNKKFEESLEQLNLLEQALVLGPKSLKKRLMGRVVQMKAANMMFTGGLDEAVEMLQSMLVTNDSFNPKEVNNTILNLAMYQFIRKEYRQTLRLFQQFEHSDNWYKKQMGVEWIFKKSIMEVILYYELDKSDLSENRIRSIERNFGQLAHNPIYRRGFVFLSLIRAFIENPYSKELTGKVEKAFEWLPKEEEDIQAMAFYSWLKCKLMKEDYYGVLLEIVKR